MLRFVLFTLFVGSAVAQTPKELLRHVAAHYSSAQTYQVKGTASALLPGTSWQIVYHFEAQGMQPTFLPLHSSSGAMKDLEKLDKPSHVRVDPNATDPYPEERMRQEAFGTYHTLLSRLIDAKDAGTETILYHGIPHQCEIVDATYGASPEYRPNSVTQHRRFWVDSAALTVLREQRSFSGKDWTADIAEVWFDKPVSAETLAVLNKMDNRPKDRPEWVGRKLPALTVHDLSGKEIRLADVRRPVLLDFWGSYCPPCKGATLHAQELAQQYKGAGLTVITFTEDSAADARLWAAHNGVHLAIVLDPKQEVFRAFDIEGIPVEILAGGDGKIIHYWTDYGGPESMDTDVKEAFISASRQ